MEPLLWQVTKIKAVCSCSPPFQMLSVGGSFGKAATGEQQQAAFFMAVRHLLPLRPSGRVSVARQKSPAPRKDNRIGTTNRSVPASVEGLAQACLIGDRPQSRHPDESTRQAHLACGWTEEPHRWSMNLKTGSPGEAMPKMDLTNPQRHNRGETTS